MADDSGPSEPLSRLTIRLSREDYEALVAFCARHGVSINAVVNASVRLGMTMWDGAGRPHVDTWADLSSISPDPQTAWQAILEASRQQDEQRRSRKGTGRPSGNKR